MREYTKTFQSNAVRILVSIFLLVSMGGCISTSSSLDLTEVMTATQQKDLLDADVILLGEQHDNPHHHSIQKQILDLVGQKGQLGSVIFEQVSWDQQVITTKLSHRTLRTLAHDLSWNQSGWPDYSLYEPLFTAAVQYQALVIAGNIEAQKIKAIYKNGYAAVFAPSEQKSLGLDQALDATSAAALEKEIFDGHCQMIPINHAKNMLPLQRARDAAMAWAFVKNHKKGQAVFIVGSGHARKDYGIPWYLRRLQPQLKVYSVALNEIDGDTNAAVYDQVITTPSVKREDPCAGLKEKFSKPRP